ncbi:gliding motility protein GldC [Fulvivirga sedimenti]|uniref:Gliding motility protein GldC n=1 Tax=Fulvivirga sedimenti TaxID=2879465 RepID=A0A9X1HJP6_9BACT|nr:gliding motility protein GldC [Fulvivirga sedimenti]MCA6073320.1 gliding motility protein GldC [Fulvivirga sedimenti]
MKTTSEINFKIELDADRIPEKILWDATEKPEDAAQETSAINISIWDPSVKNTMRIDLWTKEMPVDEMKRFYIDCLGGMGQSLLNSTGDEFMSSEINMLCDKLVEYLKKEYGN